MSHFPDEIWADWARGLTEVAQSAEIREHLSSSCSECVEALATWETVVAMARKDSSYEPPMSVVTDAGALFARHRPAAEARKSFRIAELVFDSLQSPLPEGVRSLEPATRHLSYKAGSLFIDVRIEEQRSTKVASVVGQLMCDPNATSTSLEGLSVILTSGQARLAETATNRFGEFAFEMDTGRENYLAIGVGDEFGFVVPLSGQTDRT